MVMPRSLKDPVGLAPSTLTYTRAPVSESRWGACTSGVPPSRRVTTFSVRGRRSAYSAMMPRQGLAISASPRP